MERYISERNLSNAWLKAVRMLCQKPKSEAFNLGVRIENPLEEVERIRIAVNRLSDVSARIQDDFVMTAAQTIFPKPRLYFTCRDPKDKDQRHKFYRNYMSNKNILKAANSRGTYFQRMINWPSWDTVKGVNQLENIISKINSHKASRVVHEISIESCKDSRNGGINFYNPDFDKNFIRYMSFPCLAYISIKPESAEKIGGKLHMTAVYRNHYFLQRAYGNYLGLGWLMKFIADATNKEAGELFCLSSLAKLEFSDAKISKRYFNEIFNSIHTN